MNMSVERNNHCIVGDFDSDKVTFFFPLDPGVSSCLLLPLPDLAHALPRKVLPNAPG
jgi:hypothetical protein